MWKKIFCVCVQSQFFSRVTFGPFLRQFPKAESEEEAALKGVLLRNEDDKVPFSLPQQETGQTK